MAGGSNFDVVAQAGSTLGHFMESKKCMSPLDRLKLTNWGNLDPVVLKTLEGWDPGNIYGTPYMWGTVGLTLMSTWSRRAFPART